METVLVQEVHAIRHLVLALARPAPVRSAVSPMNISGTAAAILASGGCSTFHVKSPNFRYEYPAEMCIPSSQVWVSPIAERNSSTAATVRIAANASQKECRLFIAESQEEQPAHGLRRAAVPRGSHRPQIAHFILVYTEVDETLRLSFPLLINPILDERVPRGSQLLSLCFPKLPKNA